MASPYLVLLGIAFAVGTISYLAINERQRDVLLCKFQLRRSRARESLTPPRSLSPTKQGLPANVPVEGKEYVDTFPPSRRSALAEITDPAFNLGGKDGKALSELPFDTSKPIPDNKDNFAPGNDELFTPTGFTIAEVKALGDFPDYAALSGVPLPEPYPEFDIETARARPFRPLRWAYHQTMCKLRHSCDLFIMSNPSCSIQENGKGLVARARKHLCQTYQAETRSVRKVW